MIDSFEKIITQKYFAYDVRLSVYGVLKHFDLPEILEACKDKDVTRFTSPDIGPYAQVRAQ